MESISVVRNLCEPVCRVASAAAPRISTIVGPHLSSIRLLAIGSAATLIATKVAAQLPYLLARAQFEVMHLAWKNGLVSAPSDASSLPQSLLAYVAAAGESEPARLTIARAVLYAAISKTHELRLDVETVSSLPDFRLYPDLTILTLSSTASGKDEALIGPLQVAPRQKRVLVTLERTRVSEEEVTVALSHENNGSHAIIGLGASHMGSSIFPPGDENLDASSNDSSQSPQTSSGGPPPPPPPPPSAPSPAAPIRRQPRPQQTREAPEPSTANGGGVMSELADKLRQRQSDQSPAPQTEVPAPRREESQGAGKGELLRAIGRQRRTSSVALRRARLASSARVQTAGRNRGLPSDGMGAALLNAITGRRRHIASDSEIRGRESDSDSEWSTDDEASSSQVSFREGEGGWIDVDRSRKDATEES